MLEPVRYAHLKLVPSLSVTFWSLNLFIILINYLLFLYLMRFVDAYQKARNQIIKGMCKKESHPCRQQYMKLREMILDKNVPVTDKR